MEDVDIRIYLIWFIYTVHASYGVAMIAGSERQSRTVWGLTPFLMCFVTGKIIPIRDYLLINIAVSLILVFVIYTAVKIIREM